MLLNMKSRFPSVMTRLENVFECFQKNQFKAALVSRSCYKKKRTISYSVPRYYGDTGSAILREIVPNS